MPRSYDEIYCIPVRLADGSEVYLPLAEYRSNPPGGSYELRERARYPEPASWMDLRGDKFVEVPVRARGLRTAT